MSICSYFSKTQKGDYVPLPVFSITEPSGGLNEITYMKTLYVWYSVL